MNRIILIGNGFDLAHGLKTSYKDFIKWVCGRIFDLLSNPDSLFEDQIAKITFTINTDKGVNALKVTISEYVRNLFNINLDADEFKCFSNLNKTFVGVEYHTLECRFTTDFKNKFLESLLKSHSNKGWVDIEEEYYRKLKKLSEDSNNQDQIKFLNRELEQVKDLLDEYLQSVASFYEKDNEMDELIYSSFDKTDFIDDKPIKTILLPILDRVKEIFNKNPDNDNLKNLMGYIPNYYLSKYYKPLNYMSWDYIIKQSLDNIISDLGVGRGFINYCAVPNDIMFLNFNYTPTANKYAETKVHVGNGVEQNFKVNHIHGELNQKDVENPNPIIFGYGDEISEEYMQLENMNDNTLLENVKSIRYLEANNYRDLMSFIESEEYQIYLMGHSCGISDRTLLNTLFEHKNCVSIKPFYFEWTDDNGQKHDNYREIVQNISRNFGDKVSMRNKVVNKKDCLPLPQKTK